METESVAHFFLLFKRGMISWKYCYYFYELSGNRKKTYFLISLKKFIWIKEVNLTLVRRKKKKKETLVLLFFFFYKTVEIKSQIAFHCQQGKCLISTIFLLYNHRSRDKEQNYPKVWLKKLTIGIKIVLCLCGNTTCQFFSGFEWKQNYSQSIT